MNDTIKKGVDFWKMEATSNDLVFVDGRERAFDKPGDLARAVCERHFGVGGDGLMLIETSENASVKARMFNPDGTEDFCGSGLRCTAAWLCDTGQALDGSAMIETPRGLHCAEAKKTAERTYQVAVDLVPPLFAPEDIPAESKGEVNNLPLKLGDRTVEVSSVSLGTTHTVIFVEELPGDAEFRSLSAAIEKHPMFPERTTVLWVLPAAPGRLEMRIWERGVGETMSCGTGAAAALAIAHRAGRAGRAAEVATAGGTVTASWDGAGPARLAGPARMVFGGTLRPEALAGRAG